MSRTDYIPTQESLLLAWAQNLSTVISGAPTDYGQTIESAAAYLAVVTDFTVAYTVAIDPATRTKSAISAKNTAKKVMIKASRNLVQTLQLWPGMTDAKRDLLQIPIRDNEPTPVPVPVEMPKVTVTQVSGRLISLQLLDQDDEKRRPTGVKAANLFSYAGDTPPADLKQWTYEGSVTRLDPQITISQSVTPGTEIWITALWINTKLQPGPACTPITTRTNFDGLSMNQAA